MKYVSKMFKFLKPYKKYAILAPILIVVEVAADLMLPTIMIDIVNKGIANSDFTYIILKLLLMLFLTILGAIGAIGSTYFAAKASQNAGTDIRSKLYNKIQHLSFHNLDKYETGALITRLTNDVTRVSGTIMMILRIVVRAPFMLIGSITLAIIISPELSIIFLGVIPIMFLALVLIIKRAFPLYIGLQEKVDDINTIVQENLTGIRVVKSFARENYEIERFGVGNKNLKNDTIKANRLVNLIMPILILGINAIIIMALWFGGNAFAAGSIELGNIIAFIEYAMVSLFSLLMVAMVFNMISRAEASAKRISEVLDEQNNIINNNKNKKIKLKGKVEFKNVSFEYEHGDGKEVLYGINFVIEPGETIAIVGSTGSGKSTLVNLIPRFYDVSSGEILIDDINIKNINKKNLRSGIGVALQKTLLFSGTIKSNISYGNKKASMKEIKATASIAQAAPFIEKLNEGYETSVKQRGTNLSGGQKQRIAIARAILNDPKILILDDTTSAVDVNTEGKIRVAMKKIMKDKTTFIVAQRITSAMSADRIIVLNEGELSGIGTHGELLKNNLIYQDIYNSQLGGDANE